MNILVNRTNSKNKGAELMLYAILQELERKHPDALVILPYNGYDEGLTYIKTPIKMMFRRGKPLYDFLNRTHVLSVANKLHLPTTYFTDMYPVNNIDYFIDAGGFQFSDQIGYRTNTPQRWEGMLRTYKQNGTKIVFLPQAFGPFKESTGGKLINIICKYSDIIFAREEVSFNNIANSGAKTDFVSISPDFTAPVKGTFPLGYEQFKGGIAIIPNMRMVDKGIVEFDHYIRVMQEIIKLCIKSGHETFLLNHEGRGDEMICKKIAAGLKNRIGIATGLNALEVKGLIGECYAVISSRFHGVASSLSQTIPVLATSWSHKYELLFKDFGISGSVIDVNTHNYTDKLPLILDERQNAGFRHTLSTNLPTIKNQISQMWDKVWAL